jgi:predicted Zn-dependent peptidase
MYTSHFNSEKNIHQDYSTESYFLTCRNCKTVNSNLSNRLPMNHRIYPVFLALVAILTLPVLVHSQNLESFEQNVTEFTLDNGLHFIIVQRPVAPVASFVTFVDVGGADEPAGHTGIAHIFEHMVFKGTNTVGTTNWEEEQEYIDKMDDAYRAWLTEKYRPNPDEELMEQHWADFEMYKEKASEYVVTGEFDDIISREGATGLNARTGYDFTDYFYSLPQNRAELWFSLESDRFKNPVFREFYEEKDVIREERRMGVDSDPFGRLQEEFNSIAFSAHPYGRSLIGWPSDITATTIRDTQNFFETYYTNDNFTFAIVGDVDPDEMRNFAEIYFGDVQSTGDAPVVKTIEPGQRGERRFTIIEDSQPILLVGYHTVSQTHEDWPALQMLSAILSDGRTSRMYRRLVQDDQLALAAQTTTGWPGSKYPSLFISFAIPNQGVSIDAVEAAIYEEIELVKEGDITQRELDRAITNSRAGLVRSLNSNMGLAMRLASTHGQQGDWRKLFTYVEDLQNVTLEDLQRVANEYLVTENRTVGRLINREAAEEISEAN